MRTTAAIVLAAGASVRLGKPKQLVRLGGETLLERTVRVALEAGLSPVIAVISPALASEAVPRGSLCVVNMEAAEGMASSIGAGLRTLAKIGSDITGVVLIACDQPAVTARHLRALASGGAETGDAETGDAEKGNAEVTASEYCGRKGVPAYFPRGLFAELQMLRGDVGARELLRDAKAIFLPGGELDIDTVDDLREVLKLYEV